MPGYMLNTYGDYIYLGDEPQVMLHNLRRYWAEYLLDPANHQIDEVSKRVAILDKEYSSAEELRLVLNNSGLGIIQSMD